VIATRNELLWLGTVTMVKVMGPMMKEQRACLLYRRGRMDPMSTLFVVSELWCPFLLYVGCLSFFLSLFSADEPLMNLR
jgi:hypothetical protein